MAQMHWQTKHMERFLGRERRERGEEEREEGREGKEARVGREGREKGRGRGRERERAIFKCSPHQGRFV